MKENYWDKLMGDDAGAATYMETYGEGPGFETRHFLGNFINVGESVLDVGCGPGWNMDHFAEFGPRLDKYKGIDYSQRFVRVANERRIQKRYGDWVRPFEHGDCRDLKAFNRGYDVVLLQDVLEHTNGFEKPLQEALRVANKRVIVSFWHLSDEDDPHINDDGDDGWGAWYDKREWEKFLNAMPYPWFHYELAPKDKNHIWHFYVIDKEVNVNRI